jgi:hypothetical protein
MFRLRRILPAFFLLAFSMLSIFAGAQDFTIVTLPDTQFYSASYPQIFNAQTQWIKDNATKLNIKLVLGEGDIVNGGGELGQWQNADAAMRTLNGVVPYMSAIGNHDYDHNDPPMRTASTKNFNSYFGPNRYAGQPWYRGSYASGSNENFYGVFTISGTTFLVIALEVFPRNAVLDWANSVVAANPDKEVIVLTHGYEYSDDTRIGRCDEWNNVVLKLPNDNDGDGMWNNFVRRHKNIAMVLSGHVTAMDGTGRRADLGDNGNLVNQVLADYQTLPNGGNGFLRIMTFHVAQNTIEVKTYSPWLNQYKTDAENQFTLVWHAQGGLVGQPGTITGRVRSAIDCRDIAGATVTAGGVSTTTDSRGLYKLTLPATKGTVVKVKASGWVGQAQTMDVPAGFSTQGEFFLATGGQLNGKVVDGAGAAVAGATVSLNGGYAPTSLTLTTDSTGTFKSGWISSGSYTVSASESSASATTSATVNGGATTSTTLTLASGTISKNGAITGVVASAIDGRAISGATVTVAGLSTLTSTTGAYTFSNVPMGTYKVSATKSGWLANSTSATVNGTTTIANIAMATSGKLSGTVKTSSGVMVSGAMVKISGGVIANTTTMTTNSSGVYGSAWIPVGSYTVTVSKSGLTTRTGSATVTAGGNVVLNFTM